MFGTFIKVLVPVSRLVEGSVLSAFNIAASIGRISSIFMTLLDMKACKKALLTSVYPSRSKLIVQ